MVKIINIMLHDSQPIFLSVFYSDSDPSENII